VKRLVPDNPPPELADVCALFLDMDLAILAGYEPDFAAYDQAIRKEYAHVSDADYRQGRGQFIERFLARPKIFLSEPFSGMEFSARHNLQTALDKLRQPRSPEAENAESGEKATPRVE
jgi:predicted metal-dependent HD superfamily phosphohydrolase